MKRAILAAALALGLPTAFAQSGMQGMDMKGGDMDSMHKKQESKRAPAHKASGVVTRVDPGTDKVTIRHEPVPSLNWPAMTMAFKAGDKKMLQKLKPGAKIDFDFEQQGKDYVITHVR